MKIDLTKVPDSDLLSEIGRRNNAKRQVKAGGRPKAAHRCEKCKAVFGAREYRDHKPRCIGANAA